ncbi:hypothetical protein AAZX31_01G069400 [Glycine max]|uniref:squamosa promoter-binding-like protein 8 isoform X1 n=1 Tax=Glycine max TaxID=3847 RepID=UPI001B35654D|nr:squamosa promoter-binding-like protein 8 isoform X1 [Glycine max]
MLDYEWGNPSTIILAGNEGGTTGKPDQTRRQIFDHNFTMLSNNNILQGVSHQYHHHFNPPQPHQHHAFFDPRAFQSAFTTSFSPPPRSMLSLNSIPPLATPHCGLGFLLMHKPDDVMNFEGSAHRLGHGPGLGLNLGGRTYFDPFNDNTVNRLYRTKTVESVTTLSSNLPRCQAEGCNADLSDAKHYHRRHKVCEYHSKAATVVAAGLTQRFCQQCSRFHLLSEFDNGKRSCRKRLADHNRRRRKTQQIAQEIHKSQHSLDNVATGSLPESGAQSSSSSGKVAVRVTP